MYIQCLAQGHNCRAGVRTNLRIPIQVIKQPDFDTSTN